MVRSNLYSLTSKFLNPCTPKKILIFGYIEEEVRNFAANRIGTSSQEQAKSVVSQRSLFPTHTDHAYNPCHNVHLDWFTETFPCPNNILVLPTTTLHCIHLHSVV